MSKIEIFLVLLFVSLSIISSVVKKKKEAAKANPAAPEPEEWEEEVDMREIFEAYDTISRRKAENFAENGDHFTYETAANNYDSTSHRRDKFSAKEQPESVQSIEKEENISKEFDFDAKELYKGIIYSEILQRPKYL